MRPSKKTLASIVAVTTIAAGLYRLRNTSPDEEPDAA